MPKKIHGNKLNALLIKAVEKMEIQDVQDYINQGANLNIKNSDGKGLLHMCLDQEEGKKSKEEIMQLLIKNGIDLDIKDDEGNTALHIAARDLPASYAKLLIRVGADLEAKNQEGQTPLHLSLSEEASYDYNVIKELLKCGASVDGITDEDYPPAVNNLIELAQIVDNLLVSKDATEFNSGYDRIKAKEDNEYYELDKKELRATLDADANFMAARIYNSSENKNNLDELCKSWKKTLEDISDNSKLNPALRAIEKAQELCTSGGNNKNADLLSSSSDDDSSSDSSSDDGVPVAKKQKTGNGKEEITDSSDDEESSSESGSQTDEGSKADSSGPADDIQDTALSLLGVEGVVEN